MYIRDLVLGSEFTNQTNANLLGLVILALCIIWVLGSNRKHAMLSLIVMICFVTASQRIAIIGLDFTLFRILIIFGLLRVFARNETGIRITVLDKALYSFVIVSAIVYVIQTGSIVFQLGRILDILGVYFLFRCLVRDQDDIVRFVKQVIFATVPVAIFFIVENITGRNVFSIFGGVPEFSQIRSGTGALRCQGAFSHPIIAGAFMVALMPIIASLWWDKKTAKKWPIIGLATTSIVLVASASSTPAFMAMSAIAGGFVYFFYRHMSVIRWGALAAIIGLHLVMKAPVWHLISRVSAVGGSSSYFRFLLIDRAIKNFNEWWLIGTESTAHWFWGAQDLTNQFVLVAVEGGLVSLILFILVIVKAFKTLGRLIKYERNRKSKESVAVLWSLGVSVFTLCMGFIGVAVWGELVFVWYGVMAMIASLDEANKRQQMCNANADDGLKN